MTSRITQNYKHCLPAIGTLAVTIVCCSQFVVATPGSKSKSAAVSKQSKTIQFPTSHSCGKIWLCPPKWQAIGDRPDLFGGEDKYYTFVGDARGAVKIQADALLKLRPSIDLLKDPTLLKNVSLESFAFLDLSGAEFDENTLKVIAAFPNLKRLESNMGDLTDDLLAKMVVSPKLQALFLPSTPITGTTLAHFSSLKNLQALGLACVYLKPAAYQQIGALTNITKLDLSKTNVSDDQLAALLARLPHLRNLALKGCLKLTAAAAVPLAKGGALYSVDIAGTRVTEKAIRRAQTGSHKITVIEAVAQRPAFSVPEAEKIFHPLR